MVTAVRCRVPAAKEEGCRVPTNLEPLFPDPLFSRDTVRERFVCMQFPILPPLSEHSCKLHHLPAPRLRSLLLATPLRRKISSTRIPPCRAHGIAIPERTPQRTFASEL